VAHFQASVSGSLLSQRMAHFLVDNHSRCGGIYGPKVWHSKSKYRRVIWQCNDKYTDRYNKCTAPHFSEDKLKALFVGAVNKIITDKAEILRGFEEISDEVFDSSKDEAGLERLKTDRIELVSLMEQLTVENASTVMDQKTYQNRFDQLSERYTTVNEQLAALDEALRDRRTRKTKTDLFLKALKKQDDLVAEFSDILWHSLADHAVIYSKEDVRFMFRNGVEARG
jgi:site-specific DNA recombinase